VEPFYREPPPPEKRLYISKEEELDILAYALFETLK